jgi:predicted dehydrogenase/threonine dehydrogenase-like Zn-dependent dehydrogenase
MKQILQNLRSGATEIADVPRPQARRGNLLIRTTTTLVSVGTERMLVSFGQASLIGKARSQPDKVRQVLEKIRTDGMMPTLEAVFNKLDQPLPLGYCNVGEVIEVGEDVTGFAVGDRVVSNGKHAEVVSVPKNLCAKIPAGVPDEDAAFTVLAAIGLQGIRLVAPSLGECIVVTGLGLIGLITVQLLRAQGCRVLGIDFDPQKCALAREFGAETVNLGAGEDPIAVAKSFSRGRGVDGVIITASTSSNEPVHQAATMCRKRGRIVLVGVTGLELSRADFFEKELSFQVSCSYGPGRYDPTYEERGVDYPVGFVRWTEQRNFEAVLDMVASRQVDMQPLVSHRFPIDDAAKAYELIAESAPSLGILLQYPRPGPGQADPALARTVPIVASPKSAASPGTATVGVIGSGNYATAVLIPAFKAAGARLRAVGSSGGVTALHAGRKFGFEAATTDNAAILNDPVIDAVVVATRHDDHAPMVVAALGAGKHVFVEKPLAIDMAGIAAIEDARAIQPDRMVMVGFNRRFAPQVRKMRELLGTLSEPKAMIMTVNAGAIPAEHWTQDPRVGGGRIIGEGCHFIDLLRFLAGAPIVGFDAVSLGMAPGIIRDDKATITLRFADGSTGTIFYLANGNKAFPKERLEVFAGGRILQLDNFRKLHGFGWSGFSGMNLWRQDKGQRAMAEAFIAAVARGGPSPIPFEEILEVGRVTIDIAAKLRACTVCPPDRSSTSSPARVPIS